MKNTIVKTLAMASLVLVLAGVTVQAQTGDGLEVSIPFDFTAGTAKLKAGVYTVKRMSDRALAIRSQDGKRTALLNAPLSLGSRSSDDAGQRLVFNKYGSQYFLAQVWLEFDNGRQLFTSSAEIRAAREYRLAKSNPAPERVAIAFRIN
jgi:hypothetical protein